MAMFSITYEEAMNEYQSGKSIQEIAANHGMRVRDIKDVIKTALPEPPKPKIVPCPCEWGSKVSGFCIMPCCMKNALNNSKGGSGSQEEEPAAENNG